MLNFVPRGAKHCGSSTSVDLAMQTNDVVKPPKFEGSDLGQIVLVLQGGGALGAYQSGVYHALHEAGIEPDWVIGTSIGAINAALIAGHAGQPARGAARSSGDA